MNIPESSHGAVIDCRSELSSDVDAVAGQGPIFYCVRIGISAAQDWLLVLIVRAFQISMLAQGASGAATRVLTALDARMQEVPFAMNVNKNVGGKLPEQVIAPAKINGI